MWKSVIYGCLVCVWFFDIVKLTPVPYKDPSKEELHRIALECIKEVNIDRKIIEKVLSTQQLPKENTKYKNFLACSYKKQGFLSADGKKMLYNNLLQFLEHFYDKGELKSIEHCRLIEEDDAGELSFQNLDCILEGLRAVESNRYVEYI